MSLSLIQGYSSAEEDDQQNPNYNSDHFSDDDADTLQNDVVLHYPNSYTPVQIPNSSSASALPSALLAFAEIAGPPKFLNNCVDDQSLSNDNGGIHRRRQPSRDKKDLPAGAVMEAKAQLVGIHERVRSDIEGSTSNQPKKTPDNANQPSLCLQCGIPKTYTSALGMTCPVCPSEDNKKKGSTVKDKEKVKRMRGQSSHASWKSETEMQLRQHFD